MTSLKSITIKLEPPLMEALSRAAVTSGLTLEQMAADAIEQQLEVALRHRVLLSRLEQMDEHIVALAEFVGEVSAQPTEAQIGSICRFRSGDGDIA